ncbi:hypothetical protein G3446_19575 [Thiorhodococcus minor]|uniref:Uncharacterized protein n=1 Tax=Thiorhodococcus minor TaxID=57489 RepID=A0A6M0K2R2_9GAMM|nr:hypothetical protein [Thiorhodococcus minor]
MQEVLRWLQDADEDLTLVGGQAVALREHLLGLPVLTETVDIDLLGDASQAEDLAAALGYRCVIPDPADPTPNTALILEASGGVAAGFLGVVAGLNETDILRRRICGKPGFGAACPPRGDKPHSDVFTVRALDTEKLDLDQSASPALVGFFLNQHALAKASLIAYYRR